MRADAVRQTFGRLIPPAPCVATPLASLARRTWRDPEDGRDETIRSLVRYAAPVADERLISRRHRPDARSDVLRAGHNAVDAGRHRSLAYDDGDGVSQPRSVSGARVCAHVVPLHAGIPRRLHHRPRRRPRRRLGPGMVLGGDESAADVRMAGRCFRTRSG